MTIDFRDYFWGEKHNGFDVLYQNMKSNHLATKELTEFIRERSFIEENNSKLLVKLSKQANNNSIQGTFLPLWKILKSSAEKLSSLHMQMVYGLQELMKELLKYSEEQHKKQKQTKTEELVTVEVVTELKDTITSLNKEDYENKFGVSCLHFQQIEEQHIKQMKDFLMNYYQVLESGHTLIGQVHLEFKQNCNELTVNKLLEQFVTTKGTGSERPEVYHFEETDISSINAAKNSDLLDLTNGDKLPKKEGKHNYSRHMKSKPYSRRTASLLDIFRVSTTGTGSSGFLRSKRQKVLDKKKKKKSEMSGSKEDNCSVETKDSNSVDLPVNAPNCETPVVDDEGYIIRPNFGNENNSDNHFYSSSDSDSEEEKEQKIRIKINPLTNGAPISASVDELIASAGTLSLSPITVHTRKRPDALTLKPKNRRIYTSSTSPAPDDSQMKRSISANHNISKAENDLISVFSSSLSSASTPSGIAEQKPNNSTNSNTNSNVVNNYSYRGPTTGPDRYAALSDLFTESINETTAVLSKSMSASVLGPPVLASLPRPASKRNPHTSPQLSHQSSHNSTISRCESVSSLSSDFRMTPI
ncbi:unnamed protein product, partial [Medioppia subpectinata]